MNSAGQGNDRFRTLQATLPGVALIAAIGAAAFWLHRQPVIGVLSALILSIVLGMTYRNTVGLAARFQAGVSFGLKRILRIAIALLGLQLSFLQIEQVGAKGFFVVAATLLATFLFTTWLGRRMGIERKLTQLIAAGTSICGASAVIAVNVVTDGTDEDVAYSVGTVTLFGTASMFLYPALVHLLHLSPAAFGLWAGASIHEVAQVVAAAFQDGQVSGQIGTISKLSRVMLLAPMVLGLGVLGAGARPGERFDVKRVTIPWFVLGFIAMVGVSSLGLLPSAWKTGIGSIDQFLLCAALAAMGLETHFEKLRLMGPKPMVLGAAAWIFVAAASLLLIRCLY
ncbi:MAG: YeiH family protein [Capsulimonadaceae bacterium]|nr:YeiH family protein [Capsulimonadaceae bacterium]